jgi:dsDNA-binding SOS-regulon protein
LGDIVAVKKDTALLLTFLDSLKKGQHKMSFDQKREADQF